MSAIKGFSTSLKGISAKLLTEVYSLGNIYNTITKYSSQKVAMDTAPRWLGLVSSGNTLDALPWAGVGKTKRILKHTAHGLQEGMILRFAAGTTNQYQEVGVYEVIDNDHILLDQELLAAPAGADTYSILRYLTPTLDLNGNIGVVEGQTSIVDFLDLGSLIPTGGNLIPRSSNNALEVVNSLAANVTRIQSVSDAGEFINIYTDAARTQLIAHMVLTPDETVDVNLAAGDSIFLGAAKDLDIDDAGSIIQLNFIG